MWDIFFNLCSHSWTHCLMLLFIFILLFFRIHDSRIKKGFLPPEYSSVPLGYGMPPPKIIGKVLQEKKILWKNFKEEKNNVAKEKTKHFFVWNSGCLHNKVFPWGSPEGQKKEQSHLPCQVQTCPTGATTLWKKEKGFTYYSKSM